MNVLRESLRNLLGRKAGAALSLVAGVALMAGTQFPGVLTSAAADLDSAGTFELDGNIAQDAATPPPYDWSCVFNTPSHTGCPPSSTVMFDKVFQADYAVPDATYFASNKDIQNVSDWGCVTLNNPINKDDILNAYGAAFVPTGGGKAGHLLVYLAQERDSNNGDSFAGFWLMKHQHACTSGGNFSGGHDVGDILIVSNYTNGGVSATAEVWEWDPANVNAVNNLVLLGTGFTCGLVAPPGVASPNDVCGIANGATIHEPWAPNGDLGANQFVEVGIDLSNLIPPVLGDEQSVCFADFLAETRSSQELTATLKDYTSGQFHLCVSPTVTTQQTANGHTAAAQVVLPGTSVTDQASLSGVLLGTPQGTITYKLFHNTDCSGSPVFTSGPLALSGGAVPASAPAAPTVLGHYEWQAFYSGDIALGGRNRAGHSDCGTEPLDVVSAHITIGPSAVNEVGHAHVFTVTLTADGAGSLPLGFGSISTSVTPVPGVASTTCGSPVVNANVATCTVSINNSTAGTFTASATGHVTIGGLAITVSTDGTGQNSSPAVKHYVDASVGIGPSASNEVGHQHVFDIVVTAYPAGTSPVSFASITPSVSPAPGSMSTTCANPTVNGDQATCTLTIDSDLPDTFVANVTAQVTMGGVTVTRSTSGNAGPGGTGPATKNYVTANIGLSPLEATDPVGDLHTLTATVTTNDGSGHNQPQPAPDGTVVSLSIVSGPGSLASPNCTISNGLGTCTDVLTSNVEGTTVVNASVTVTVDGVTLHRSTNDSVPGDSPNAVKHWGKVQPSISTTQSAGGTIGLTSVSDTATVSGGLNPTGTVTFQLFAPGDDTCSGTPVFTSSDRPLSNGVAQSDSFTPSATGTYQWVAIYNGDDANLTVVSGCGDEPVTLLAAQVLGITTPNTGAGLQIALAEGLALVVTGTGIFALARRRRRKA